MFRWFRAFRGYLKSAKVEVRNSNKTVSERGAVPFCSEDSAKLGQSPTVLLEFLNSASIHIADLSPHTALLDRFLSRYQGPCRHQPCDAGDWRLWLTRPKNEDVPRDGRQGAAEWLSIRQRPHITKAKTSESFRSFPSSARSWKQYEMNCWRISTQLCRLACCIKCC